MNKLNNKKGISLIVLVITIIVMIVLAAAIILSLQSSGIIGRANEAKSKTDIANAKQVVAMAEAEWKLDEEKIRKENSSIQSFKDYANKKLNEVGYATSGNGGISLSESGAINTIYVDAKGKQAIIPEGFVVSSVSTEKTIDDGLVIIDEAGNEFVWVPVESIDEFITRDGYMLGNKEGYVSNGYVIEPFSGVDNGTTMNVLNDLTGEHAEYAAMMVSVEKNKGFYIGRYEAGTTVERKVDKDNGTTEVVVQKNKPVYSCVSWGPSMTDVTGDVIYSGKNQGKGAVELSRKMYKSSVSVVSTLCYGVQWDAAINFMKNVPNPNIEGKKYIEDGTGMGVHGVSTPALSGSNAAYKVKNIYDMSGNLAEWTMEATVSYNSRVFRGSPYFGSGSEMPASSRSWSMPSAACDVYGFRVALYLK